MKITYRVPTRQYAYMEVEIDNASMDNKNDKIVEQYFKLEDEYRKQANAKNEESKKEVPFETPDVKCGAEGSKTRDDYLK